MTGPIRPEPRDDLRALEGYHSPQLDVSVRLNTNESPFAPPDAFLDEWTAAIRSAAHHRYPDRAAGELRRALGAALGHDAARVFAANGSNEVLQTILLTYGGPGRKALVFEPTYALHSHISRITATGVIELDRRADFTIDLDAAIATVERERPTVVFVCSPNNPTGTVESPDSVLRLSDACDAVGALLVVDEAYGEFAAHSALQLVDESRGLVVVRTYSKVWSLAAVRLGFCIGPDWVVAELDKVVLPYHLSVPTQLAGTLALAHETEMRRRVEALVAERERISARLRAHPGLTVYPSGANFVLFRVHGDGKAVWQALVDQGVLVRDFSRWPRVEECLRVTVGTPTENDAFLTSIEHALTALGITQ